MVIGKPAVQHDPHLVQPNLFKPLDLTEADYRAAALTVAEYYADDPEQLRETLAMLGLDEEGT